MREHTHKLTHTHIHACAHTHTHTHIHAHRSLFQLRWSRNLQKQEKLHGKGHPGRSNFFYSKWLTRKCTTLVMTVTVMEWNNRNGPIQWQISLTIKSYLSISRKSLTFLRYSYIKIREFKNVGQSHDVRHSQWRHSKATIWLLMWWQ